MTWWQILLLIYFGCWAMIGYACAGATDESPWKAFLMAGLWPLLPILLLIGWFQG